MGSSRFVRKVAIGLLASGTVIGLTAAAGAASAAPQGRHPLDGSMPKWLHQAHDMGASSSAQQMNFGVLLGMRDQAGAMATLKAISDPASSSYGKWLTNAEFDARYAPAKSAVTAVQNWLRAEGFQVNKILPSGMYVEASGSVAKVESAFGTSVHNYSYLGKDVHANNIQLSLPANTPAAVTSAISGVMGVDQGTALKHTADTEPGPPPGARYGVQPCSAYYAQKVASDKPTAYGKHQPYTVCGYGPRQFQGAYGESALLKAGINGRGTTVAITDAYAAPSPARVHQPAVLPAARHPGAARHRGADLASGPGPHRLHEFPGQQPGQVLAAGDRRRTELDPERHPWLRRRDRSGHAARPGVLPQRPALTSLIARGPGKFAPRPAPRLPGNRVVDRRDVGAAPVGADNARSHLVHHVGDRHPAAEVHEDDRAAPAAPEADLPVRDVGHGVGQRQPVADAEAQRDAQHQVDAVELLADRKSTRLNSSHPSISYAVFCLKKKKHTPTSSD